MTKGKANDSRVSRKNEIDGCVDVVVYAKALKHYFKFGGQYQGIYKDFNRYYALKSVIKLAQTALDEKMTVRRKNTPMYPYSNRKTKQYGDIK